MGIEKTSASTLSNIRGLKRVRNAKFGMSVMQSGIFAAFTASEFFREFFFLPRFSFTD